MATLSAAERRAVNLTWAKPFDGNSPLIRYVLEMSENSKAAPTPSTDRSQGDPTSVPLSQPSGRPSSLICKMSHGILPSCDN